MQTARWIRNLGGALALCILATPALAGELRGVGPVVAKNMQTQAIQIYRDVYYVDGSTIMRDQNGDLIGLADLDVPTTSSLDQSPRYADYDCDFEAVEVSGKMVLTSLVLEPGEMD